MHIFTVNIYHVKLAYKQIFYVVNTHIRHIYAYIYVFPIYN